MSPDALDTAARAAGAMMLGEAGTKQQYLFDLEQLGRLVELASERERELPPLPY